MTVSYSHQVSTGGTGHFLALLLWWKGSIYRLMYKEFIVYIVLYFLVSLLYRFGLNDRGREVFEGLSIHFEKYAHTIPLTFVLGFYVSQIISRWWHIFEDFAFPDLIACDASMFITGEDPAMALYLRRTLVRYMNLCHVLVLREVSKPIRDRFPNFQHLIDKGYMTEEEVKLYHRLDSSLKAKIHNYWIPWQWACSLIVACRKEGYIANDAMLVKLYNDIQAYKSKLSGLISYDWITIPLCYTQIKDFKFNKKI